VWVDRDGQEQSLPFEPQPYVYPRISPRGDRLAVAILEDVVSNVTGADLWVFDLERGSRSRITFGGNNRFFPVWTPAGDQLTFSDSPTGDNTLHLAAADGSGRMVTLMEREGLQYPTSWSPNGQTLAYHEDHPQTTRDLWTRTAEGDPQLFLGTPAQERAAAFSPDGRWMAFVSDKSGLDEIYVRPFPGPGLEFTISTGGGTEPVWSRDGLELFYRSEDQLMVVTVDLGDTFRAETPQPLFADIYERDASGAGGVPNYDISPAGRFVMVRPVASAVQNQVVVVLNWAEELRERVPN
jgi:serine/threonine-protein kinase